MKVSVDQWMKTKRATQREVDEDGSQHVRYHNTRVVSWLSLGNGRFKVTLRNGGHLTATTKVRMNEVSCVYLGNRFSVYQEKFEWFVLFRDGRGSIPFEDGMEFEIKI